MATPESPAEQVDTEPETPPNLTQLFTPNLTRGGTQTAPQALAPLPEKFDHSGRGPGRINTFWETIEMLTVVRETGQWPGGVSPAMQRYYKREYPEFFSNGKRAANARTEKQERARRIKAENRPRRKKVQRNTGSAAS
jgi:hypothetical protein